MRPFSLVTILNMLIMFSFFGCGKKKAASNEVGQWLNKNFPQKFEIIENKYAVNTWTSLDRSKFRVVLSDKNDGEIQFTIFWNTAMDHGGTSIDEVNRAFQNAHEDAKHARVLNNILKQHGLTKTSAGVTKAREGYLVDVLFYENLLPADRLTWFSKIREALNKWNLSNSCHFWFGIMEPDFYGKDFELVIPSRYIHEWTDGKRDYCILWAETQWTNEINYSDLKFAINLNSQRALTKYTNDAFQQASVWAKTNSKKTIYLRNNGITTEANANDPLAIDYCIPYFLSEQAASAEMQYDEKIPGYVCGTYFVEEGRMKSLSMKQGNE